VEALVPLSRAVELQPGNVRAWANLGGALNQLRRFDEAARVLTRAGAVIRDSPEARFNLGVALAALGDRAGAAGEAEALERLSPGLAARLWVFLGR
jgi:Flp pilus assembly protein TadD